MAALEETFGGGYSAESVSEGEMARQTLHLLADDPRYREGLQALLSGPTPERFMEPVTAVAITTAVLLVLQTHVKFERDKAGQWLLKIEKKPTETGLLDGLVKKLLTYVGK